ncbi:hypothetical protein E2C01_078598 [Portunus trituberculatus]|uniref:Uncharacterized protein n=1 Tax=Portunus trituberculatus TaxID=210409 RepID=A0A5B7IQN3_PORTR|nr:hypothetical protein [Portunus trituberculatus]
MKQEMCHGLMGSPTPRAEGVTRQMYAVQVSTERGVAQAEMGDYCCSLRFFL